MTPRYFVTSREFDDRSVIWYVKDRRVPDRCNPYIVARCSSQADAQAIRDAFNHVADAEAFLAGWLSERMHANRILINMALRDFRAYCAAQAETAKTEPGAHPRSGA